MIAVTSSSCPAAVMRNPRKNSLAGIVRSPLRERTVTVASSAERTTGSSAAGSAWATLPPAVPRLRIAGCPMYGSASASSGDAWATAGSCSSSANVVSAPMRRPPLVDTPRSSAIGVMSTRVTGRASRRFISATRLWPPASAFASPSPAARRSSASSTDSARRYSKLGGFTPTRSARRRSRAA